MSTVDDKQRRPADRIEELTYEIERYLEGIRVEARRLKGEESDDGEG